MTPAGRAERTGLGTEILTRTLPYQLDATAQLNLHRDGISYELIMPDSILTASDAATGEAPQL